MEKAGRVLKNQRTWHGKSQITDSTRIHQPLYCAYSQLTGAVVCNQRCKGVMTRGDWSEDPDLSFWVGFKHSRSLEAPLSLVRQSQPRLDRASHSYTAENVSTTIFLFPAYFYLRPLGFYPQIASDMILISIEVRMIMNHLWIISNFYFG